MTHAAFRYDIQALRAFSVLAVILFHINPLWMPGGFLGVDFFFVISGFIITRKIVSDLDARKFSLKDFYVRRIKRLFPALFVTTAATVFLGLWLLPAESVSALIHTALATIGSVSNFYFWLTAGYFEPDALERPLLHTWSLGVEEQFYLIFPCLLMILARVSKFAQRFWILALLIISVIASQWALQHAPNAAFYLLPFRGFEFLAGAFVAMLPPLPGPSHRLWTGIWAALFAALVSALFIINAHTPLPGVRALILCAPIAGLLYIAPKARGLERAAKLQFLQFIGNASYSLYLVHWPLIVFLQLRFPSHETSLWLAGLCLSLTLLLGAGLHHFIEKPYRYNTLKRNLKGPVALSLTAILSASFVTTVLRAQELQSANLKASMTGKSVLLIGDSNAEMYKRAIVNRLKRGRRQLSLISSPGCPPLLGVRKIYTRENPEKNQGRCDDMMLQLEAELAAHPAKIVILAARWEFYVARPAEGRNPPRQDFLYKPGTKYNENINVTRRLFKEGIDSMVSTLTDAGKTVVIIGQIPSFHNQDIRCARQNIKTAPRQMAAACKMAHRDSVEKQYRPIRARLDTPRENGDGKVIYIDPVSLLCEFSHCEVGRGGRILYENGTHLNNFGAEVIIDALASRLADR